MAAEIPWATDPAFVLIGLDASDAIAAEDMDGIAVMLRREPTGEEQVVHVHEYDNLSGHLEAMGRHPAVAALAANFVAIRRMARPHSNTPFENFRTWVASRSNETAALRLRLKPAVRY